MHTAITAWSQAPGALDVTFDQDGLKYLDPGQGNAFSRDILLQPDGKMLVAGISVPEDHSDFTVIRLLADGQPDASFGNGGMVTTDFGGLTDIIEGIALDKNGNIIAAGYVDTGDGFAFAICRYLSNGELDTMFGEQGKVITQIGVTGFLKDVAVLDNNRIVVCGYAIDAFTLTNEFVAARFTEDGHPDSTFNETGIVRINTGIGAAVANAMCVQQDGSVLMAGQVFNETTLLWDLAVTRLDRNGILDPEWNEDGIAVVSFPGKNFTINAVDIQADDKVVVGGFLGTAPSNNLFVVARFQTNGHPDMSFGDQGLVVDSYGAQNNQILGLAVQPDQRILIGGASLSGNMERFALARLESNGDFDTSFGNQGVVITIPGQNDGIEAMDLQQDGKLVVAGESFDGTRFDIVAARYETGLMTSSNGPRYGMERVNVFPNPAQSFFRIQFTASVSDRLHVALIDVQGHVVVRLPDLDVNGGEEVLMHVPVPVNISTGIYNLHISGRNTNQVTKVVLQP